MKILAVDDSKTMLRIIKNVLLRLNYEDIDVAEDGQEAYEMFINNNYELIITDWNMPVMDGLTLVKEIRKLNADIPIIMVTTEGGKREVITALKAGVNNYIVKPFTPQVLKDKLESIL